jgi:hypothetical protein
MKKSEPIRMSVLLLMLCAGKLFGQSSVDSATGPDSLAQNQSSADTSSNAPKTPDASEQQQYVPSLMGSGLVRLDDIQSFHILTGGTISTGVDTNPTDSTDGQASALYSFAPYLGIAAGSARSQFMVQYRPIFTGYSAYSGNALQQASATFTNHPNPRWNWTIGMDAVHGDNSVRLLAPSHSIAVGGVAGSGSDAASYLPNAGTVTDINGGLDLQYNLSPRDALKMQISNSYNSYPQSHESGGLTTETVNYTHAVRPTLAVLAYGQTSEYYLDVHCNTVGGGVGITWQPSASAEVSLQGGPQLNSPACNQQQGFSYHAYFSNNITGQSQFYIRSDRQAVNGFLGPGLWQNDVSGGYQRKFLARNAVSFDLGYLESNTLVSSGHYSGFFGEASYTRQIEGPFSLTCRYQNYEGTQANTRFTRNLLAFSLVITPKAPSFFN